MTRLNKKIHNFVATLFVILFFVFIFFASGGVATVYAATSSNTLYTNVIDDLKKDSGFKPSNYPENAEDYGLKVIQLAESADKELFIYVYQPSGQTKKLNASSINISTTINDFISFKNYKLKLLSDSGTLFKYKVENFIVKTESTRYYVITSIFRPFDESIDKQASGGNVITEVEYAVKRQYCFGEINGKPYVSCVDIETIEVTDKFVGYVRCPDGFNIFHPKGACDSHFVAFNTDKRIDKLLEADVYYTTQKVSLDYFKTEKPFKTDFGESKTDNYAYLKYDDRVEHTGGGLFAGTYKWDRIQSVEDFVSEVDGGKREVYSGALFNVSVGTTLTDEAKSILQGKKWVLRFTETDYTESPKSGMGAVTYYHSESTIVGDVTILRLKFETDGITYNLGTIDNKQTGSDKPINSEIFEIIINNRGKRILAILAAILLLIILAPLLPYIIKFVVCVISLPFKVITALFKGIKKRGKQSGKKTK